jgi:2'-5' RNA ligase
LLFDLDRDRDRDHDHDHDRDHDLRPGPDLDSGAAPRLAGCVRLFFSVPLPEEQKRAVNAALRPMKAASGEGAVSWTKAEQLHFTLAFLGEQPASEPALQAAAACAELRAFELALAGAGAFPNSKRPRILWLGAAEGAKELEELAARLTAGLRAAGFALEERPFRAHLTVGRVKPGGDRSAERALKAGPQGEVARLRVHRVVLVQSRLSPQGARHEELASVSLQV